MGTLDTDVTPFDPAIFEQTDSIETGSQTQQQAPQAPAQGSGYKGTPNSIDLLNLLRGKQPQAPNQTTPNQQATVEQPQAQGSQRTITPDQMKQIEMSDEISEKTKKNYRNAFAIEQAQETAAAVTKEEKDVDNEYNAVISIVDKLERDYNEAGLGQETGLDAQKEGISTFFDILMKNDDAASQYVDNKKGFVATLKSVTGDTGVLTKDDADRLLGILPKLNSTKGEAPAKFQDIRDQVAAMYGQEPTKTTFGQSPDNVITNEQVDDGTLPESQRENVPQVTAPTDPTTQEPQKGGLLTEEQLKAFREVPNASPFQTLAEMFTPRGGAAQDKLLTGGKVSGNEALGVAGEGASNLLTLLSGGSNFIPKLAASGFISGFTDPENKGLGDRVKSGSADAVVSATLAGALKYAPKVLRPFKAIGEYRAAKIAEAEGKTISGDKIIAALEEGARTVSPTTKKSYEKFLKVAKETYKGVNMSVDDAVKLNSAANDAFLASGKVGKAASSKFNKILGDVIKAELSITAKSVSNANKAFTTLYNAEKFGKKHIGGILKTATGAYILKNVLGGNQQ